MDIGPWALSRLIQHILNTHLAMDGFRRLKSSVKSVKNLCFGHLFAFFFARKFPKILSPFAEQFLTDADWPIPIEQ